MNPTIASLMERKSVRSFEKRPIPEKLRELVVEAALQAPTAGNQTLYTIIDVRNQVIKDQLAVLCDNQPFIASAPMVHVFLADCRRWLAIYRVAEIEPRDPQMGDLMIALADGIIAAQNAVTAAWSLGIGSCYIGDVLERREEMSDLLALKQFLVPAAMVVYGYPTEQQIKRAKPRRVSQQLIVHTDRYTEPASDQLKEELARVNQSPEILGEPGGRSIEFSFTTFVRAFHDRKYASEFARDLNRSAEGYVREFL